MLTSKIKQFLHGALSDSQHAFH